MEDDSKLVPNLQSIFGSLMMQNFQTFHCEFSLIYVQTGMTHQVAIMVVIIDVAIQFPHGMGSCRTGDLSMMWFQFGIKLIIFGPTSKLL